MAMTRDETTGTWVAQDGSHWKRIRNGRGETKGWLEVFGSRRAGYVSVPGASRWMEG